MIYSSWAYSGNCLATILCAGDETAPQLIGFIFLLGTGQRNKLCIRGHASTNKPDWLSLHIHVSQCRFIASWHNVRTINVSYVARLTHYPDSLTCCSFKHKMYTAQANKAFWVCGCPLWRDGGLCSPKLTAVVSLWQELLTWKRRRGDLKCLFILMVAFSIWSSGFGGLAFSYTVTILFFILLHGLSLLLSCCAH